LTIGALVIMVALVATVVLAKLKLASGGGGGV